MTHTAPLPVERLHTIGMRQIALREAGGVLFVLSEGPMTDRELLVSNLECIDGNEQKLRDHLYAGFFARYPSAHELFGRHSLHAQRLMLYQTLVTVVEHLDDEGWVQPYLKGLGVEHRIWDVTPEMYDWFVDCLLESLAHVSGASWSTPLEAAWRRQLEWVCQAMLDGHKNP